ncbi:cytochrome c oxidase subunit II [Thalassobacillus pellis]|uniref:cytochrome c oxidase subunit II n=1 Tax=Thalassobacillus pellis TaxID=748008 RepID=UPI0019610FC9|nr:cytochrome c oxidase subunit II [Thalassobacillus pellis]MBM7553673.1 cytochrome c oxidase subunit 2 [Thalassobacillus pellis]
MHLHRYEKIWLSFGIFMLLGFMGIVGYQTFAMGMGPPSHKETIDPQKVETTAPFDEPGVKQIGDNEYEVVMILQAFGFTPGNIEVPVGAKVNFTMTSKDVIHGFQVADTNINTMVVPGHIQKISHTFNEPGEYLVICNEYCGAGHQAMATRIIVK